MGRGHLLASCVGCVVIVVVLAATSSTRAAGAAAKEKARTKADAEPKAKGAAKDQRSDDQQIERQKQLLRKNIEKKFPKNKADGFFVIALADVTFHKDVQRTIPPEIVEINGERLQKKSTEFRFGQVGESFPVVEAKFEIVESRQAAIDSVFDHMAKYVRPSSRGRSGKKNIDSPLPTGDWRFVGRFKDKADAQNALAAAKDAFEAEPRWVVPQNQEATARGKAKGSK